jgi:ABC-type dipeptide/oligopeptide/nickel transport system permease subunit
MKGFASTNYPLWIGLLLGGFLLFVAIAGPRLAPYDPMEVFNDVMFIGDEMVIPARTPVPPLALDAFTLGTDVVGRDLYSRLLWAVRPTLILCVIIASLRIILGVALGLAGGWYGGPVGRFIEVIIDLCRAIPILLFALAVLSYFGHEDLSAFILALVTTGWAGTAVFVRQSTAIIKKEPYILGAHAVGVQPLGILSRYVLPQLWPALPALIAFEIAAALLVVAELGFLGMFIGEAFVIMIEAPDSAGTLPSGVTATFPELAQMVSDFWRKMIQTPWEVALVGSAIFLTIFTFNMLGEGLRRHMDVTRPRKASRRRSAQAEQPSTVEQRSRTRVGDTG